MRAARRVARRGGGRGSTRALISAAPPEVGIVSLSCVRSPCLWPAEQLQHTHTNIQIPTKGLVADEPKEALGVAASVTVELRRRLA